MSRIELRPPRWVHVPFLIADVILLSVFWQVVFGDGFGGGDAFSKPEEFDLGFKLVFGFFMAIGVFMFFVLGYRILKNPATLVLDGEGLYLNPAGVELGRFRWDEIAEIRETEVIGQRTSRTGPALVPAIAIVLKDPDAYIKRFPKVMAPLFKFREGEAGTPLLIEPGMLGKRYDEIVKRMRDEVARAHERSRR